MERKYSKIDPPAMSSAPYIQEFLKYFLDQIPYKKNGKIEIFDAGSGLGFNLAVIHEIYPNSQITALDTCEDALSVSKLGFDKKAIRTKAQLFKEKFSFDEDLLRIFENSRGEKGFNPKRVIFRIGDVQDLNEIEDGSFDIVVCTEVLEHISSPQKAVKELGRVTKGGGYLIISTPNYYHNPISLMKRHYDQIKGEQCWDPWGVHEEGRENHITADFLEMEIKKNGLKIGKTLGANYWLSWFPPFVMVIRWRVMWRINPFDKFPIPSLMENFILKKTAMNYFILAEKEKMDNSRIFRCI